MKASLLKIREVPASVTYPVRQLILRPRRPVEETVFEGDTAADSFHLGAFLEDRLVGVTSFMKNAHPNFSEAGQYQMRGMAVLSEAQGQHVGRQLLAQGERLLKEERKASLLWFNARESAEAFYRKYQYLPKGDYFDIPKVCTHIVMYKRL